MAKKIEISEIRAQQFNKMVEMLRDIRRYDVKKKVKELGCEEDCDKEEALERTIGIIQRIAVGSRGISELK